MRQIEKPSVMVEMRMLRLTEDGLKDHPEIVPGKMVDSAKADAFVKVVIASKKASMEFEPRLVARSGEPASIMTGGEVPVIADYKVRTVGGVTKYEPKIEKKEFGNMLDVLPVVSADGKSVDLMLNPRIVKLGRIENIAWPGPDGKGAPPDAKDWQM